LGLPGLGGQDEENKWSALFNW